jgi:hypothetical protein
MKKFALALILTISQAHALDAVITVLEAPMLNDRSTDAKVVQQLRRGDIIRIHPGYNPNLDYEHLAPSAQKQKELLEKWRNTPEAKEDPIFQGKSYDINPDDRFVPTLDRSGNTVYVLREHIFIYYENEKELEQPVKVTDETDYRLLEPLPKKYPLYSPTGYRGQFTFGVAQTYLKNYPYAENIRSKGYQSPLDFTITLMRQAPDDKHDRLYIGGLLSLRTFKNDYILFNGRNTSETYFKAGLGPAISYDAYKTAKNRLSLNIAVNVWLWDSVQIEQSDRQSNLSDKRGYKSYTFAPRAGVQYHRKQILEDVDFVLGFYAEGEWQHTYRTSSKAQQNSWWTSEKSDQFNAPTLFNLVGIIGLQSAY